MEKLVQNIFPLAMDMMSLGVLLSGVGLFVYLYIRTWDKLHLATAMVGIIVAWFVCGDYYVCLAALSNDPEAGRQMHRFQALSVTTFLFVGPYFVYHIFQLVPRWKSVNGVLAGVGFFIAVGFIVVAFVAPALFVSVSDPAPAELGMHRNFVRGAPGPLFWVRDVLCFSFFIYVIVMMIAEAFLYRQSRYVGWLFVGLVFGVGASLIALFQFYSGYSYSNESLFGQVPLVAIGGTVFAVCTMLGVMSQFVASMKEVENAYRFKALSQFAGGIAHDFKNVLAGISGCTQIIKKHSDNSKSVLKYSQLLEDATVQANELIERLVLFSQDATLVVTTVSLEKLIGLSVELVATGTQISKKNIQIEQEIAADLRPVSVNEQQIAQVIQNLLINAVQSMSQGGTIKVAAQNDSSKVWAEHPDLRKKNYVIISIVDQGKGIEKKYLERVFEPYYTTKEEGTGLGLAISRSVVNDNKGFVYVASKPGEGTTFDICLPAVDH